MSDVKSNKCTVYIDEAGDLGINRGTKWFVITGVIVPKDNEKQIRDVLQQAKTEFNLKEIHMRKLGDFYKSAYIVSQLREQDFTTVNVLMDTDKCPLKDSIKTYNFLGSLMTIICQPILCYQAGEQVEIRNLFNTSTSL